MTGSSVDGRVPDCYIHSLFNLSAERRGWIDGASNGVDQDAAVDAVLDDLAAALERHVAVNRLLAIAGQAAKTVLSVHPNLRSNSILC